MVVRLQGVINIINTSSLTTISNQENGNYEKKIMKQESLIFIFLP